MHKNFYCFCNLGCEKATISLQILDIFTNFAAQVDEAEAFIILVNLEKKNLLRKRTSKVRM